MELCSKPVLSFMDASSKGNRSSLADDRLVWKLSDNVSEMPPFLQLSDPNLRKSGYVNLCLDANWPAAPRLCAARAMDQ